jgi:hypothetical protein
MMTDFSHLSDAQFLLATTPLEADTPSHMIRCTCGNVFEVPKFVHKKRCPNCESLPKVQNKPISGGCMPHGRLLGRRG